jgi:uncharacterized protein (DUF1015 family)
MSRIFPFAALRPTPESAAAVAAVPYDVVSTDEARALASGNPLSFLHVSRPEIDLPAGADPHADPVYVKAMESFAALKKNAPLVIEDRPAIYIYRLHMGGHVQTGVAACFSIDEYDSGGIKKHEKTRPDKEDDRTRHMLAIRAQTGPVFLTYKASTAIDSVVALVVNQEPLFDLTAPDGVRHQIWRATVGEGEAIAHAFESVPALYIADGHHRAASAARSRKELVSKRTDLPSVALAEAGRVLAVAFPDNQVQVLPYNRVVKDLHGRSPAAFMAALKSVASVREGGPASPKTKGDIAMYLGGDWYTLEFPKGKDTLDVDVLETAILGPLLGIQDIRTDKRIDFVGGIRGTGELETLVNAGKYAVAFSLYPVAVHDLMRIADAGGIMPPKSTWFEPKLRDGLLSHLI